MNEIVTLLFLNNIDEVVLSKSLNFEKNTMTKKVGFDFNEFGGNVDVVILEVNSDDLNNSIYVKSLQSKGKFKQVQGLNWSFFDAKFYFSN